MAPEIIATEEDEAESCGPHQITAISSPKCNDSLGPIAVVGMACRWPGDSKSGQDIETPEALWDFLQEKRNAYSEFPAHRINIDAWYHPEANRPGSFYTRGGAFLKADPRQFDPSFFGINPQEAMSVDPAQRKFLEVVFEAFESGGVPLDKVSGSKTGCFVGNFNYDHQLMQYRDTEYPEPYGITGGGIALLSNRVSYVFNLHGPSMTLDTACSSSMYALHLACTSIQSGECDAAVVGGSNLILTPECQVFSSSLGAISKTSRCHTFDAAADGYARADGIGALYIKSLKQALADNDPIRAIIRGTAINANGKTGGITHPDPSGQEKAIRRAYERAGISDFGLTSYFECHGTGTPVGDPLEVEAVGRVFSQGRTASRPLLIGSIKSNMGHCEPASGIAGIMKSVLALERGTIPPIESLEKVNPNLDLKSGSLHIVQETTPWPDGPVRRASVNSFGYGGANAHTILDDIDILAPGRGGARSKALMTPTRETINSIPNGHLDGIADHDIKTSAGKHCPKLQVPQSKFLLPLSAHNEGTLKKNIEALSLCANQWSALDLSYTLGCSRSTFSNRSFVIANAGQAEECLRFQDVSIHRTLGSSNVSLGFVFTGQGAQWPQMGLELMDSFPTYLKAIRDMDAVLGNLRDPPDWRIEDCLRAKSESSQVYSAKLSQPLVTAVQVALVDLLASWNIRSKANVGHSSGEIAAAYASGRITAAEAILSAYARGRAVSRNKRNGAMLAVGLGADETKKRLSCPQSIVIACYNSPNSVTLSGDKAEILALEETLATEKIFARVLATDGNAYHSYHMNSLGGGYEEHLNDMLSSIDTRKSSLLPSSNFFSSKEGGLYPNSRIDPTYWRSNLESPVLFHQALTSLVETKSVDILLEIGPHTALKGPLRQISASMPDVKFPEYIPTLVREGDGAENLLQTAGLLFAKGYKVAMERVNAIETLDTLTNRITSIETGTTIVDLPKYQWQYEELFYVENRWTREWRLRSHPRHDFLGSRNPGGNKNEPSWRNILRLKDLPWLVDHKIADDVVFPTSAYLCMAIEAVAQTSELRGFQVSQISKFRLQDVYLDAALLVPKSGGVEVLFSLRPAKLNSKAYHESLYDFTVTSVLKPNGSDIFTEHCHGQIGFEAGAPVEPWQRHKENHNLQKIVSVTQWYNAFRRIGLCYGSTFQGLSDIKAQADAKIAESRVKISPTKGLMIQESRYFLHPAALDSVLQLAIIAAHGGRHSRLEAGFLPVFIQHMSIWPVTTMEEHASANAQSKNSDARTITCDVKMNSPTGFPILNASDIRLVQSESSTLSSLSEQIAPFTRMEWKPNVDFLDASSLSKIFPSGTHETGDAELSTLDLLALHQSIQFYTRYPKFFNQGSQIPHLQRLLDWITGKVAQVRLGQFSNATEILNLTMRARDEEIARLFLSLMDKHGPETRLMSHMYESLPAIYRGEMTGIEAAVQDHLLDDMYEYMTLYHDGSSALKDLVALLSHKTPQIKILEVGGGTGSATREILPALNGDSQYRGYESYTFTDIGPAFLATAQESFKDYKGVIYKPFDMQTDAIQQGFDSDFDVVIASNVIHATTNIRETLKNVRRLLKPGGKLVLFEFVKPRLSWNMILGTFSDFWNGDSDPNFPRTEGPFLTRKVWDEVLPQTGYHGVDVMLDHFSQHGEAAIIVATARESAPTIPPVVQPSEKICLVVRDDIMTPFICECVHRFQASGVSVGLVALTSASHLAKERVVSLVEADRPFFLDASNTEWEAAKRLLLDSKSILWVTRGSLLTGKHPEYALISGIACAIHTENLSSRLVIADFDRDESFLAQNLEALVKLEQRAATYATGDDFEFRLKAGVVHISRLVPDEALNADAKAKVEARAKTEMVPLQGLGDMALTLVSENIGPATRAYFEESTASLEPLQDDCVQIEVKAFAFNSRSIRYFSSNAYREIYGCGCAGIITHIGSGVTALAPGDRVFCVCPTELSTHARTKAIFCQVMGDEDSFEFMAAIPEATCTAMYGLRKLAKIEGGESVLILSAASPVGQIACQIAQTCQAKIYAVVESEEARKSLLEQNPGISESQIFAIDGKGITGEILRETSGGRVNMLLSCLEDDRSHEYWDCLAPFGRVIDVGCTNHVNAPDISISTLPRGATYTSFDLGLLSQSQPAAVSSLMAKIKELYSSGTLRPPNIEVRPAGQAEQALREITRQSVMVLSTENKEQEVELRRLPASTTFDPDASYLLVGCLGGLGRSFADWMVRRGARNLIFLSRSGVSGQEAKIFVSELERVQVKVTVVQGDVTNMTDVRRAIDASSGSIKGVVQAPLTLNDSFFDDMTLSAFNTTMQPRVIGTLNLLHALHDAPLDFFMLWSSWTSILGSASQSNYMASSSFMDAFAQHRRAHDEPATSLSLGQILDIGIVSHTPEYQENLHRMGLHGNSEDDFLSYCDAALSSTAPTAPSLSHSSNGHLLAGMAPSALSSQSATYPLHSMSWHRDPRFSLLLSAAEHSASSSSSSSGNATVLVADDDPSESLLNRIHKRVGRLLYIPREDIDVARPLNAYGIDSMVAAELRNWLFGVSGVEVSLLNMLHPGMTIGKLAGLAVREEEG